MSILISKPGLTSSIVIELPQVSPYQGFRSKYKGNKFGIFLFKDLDKTQVSIEIWNCRKCAAFGRYDGFDRHQLASYSYFLPHFIINSIPFRSKEACGNCGCIFETRISFVKGVKPFIPDTLSEFNRI